ncbi:MAG: arylamine N-acetyltransferase [Candidatus Zixiibacteriota bacterium]|nr:MAG: arylamine N-acetyltransferase [candidate division Zixibacteria bacterium]
MSNDPEVASTLNRLMRLLGLEHPTPTLGTLEQLVMAFVTRVPFENISKLYYLRRDGLRFIPDLETYVGGIEQYHFGGTCYSNNYYLHRLLTHLGYDAKLCGADMNNPDVHLTNIVRLDGKEYLIDVGYAAPFLVPMPLDLNEDFVIELGRDSYRLRPRDENGNSCMQMFREGQLRHGYTVKPTPRHIQYFEKTIRNSFRDGQTFMNSVLLVRYYPNRSTMIHNLSIIKSVGTDYSIDELSGLDELPAAIEKYFSIPRDIVSVALSAVGELGDSWT